MQNVPYRPHYHVTPAEGWINDPNGLVYFQGEWHLFYQYFEPRQVEGMQWGHAVSRDLVHWETLPPAVAPDTLGHIWSGSAVVDRHDSSGLLGGRSGIVCCFTYWDPSDRRQCQGLAYSRDGRRFDKFAGNPVIPQLRYLDGQPDEKDFRDPKIFWYAPGGHWVMAVAGGKLRVFTSPDLIHWRFQSVAEDLVTECPDLFELPVDGDASRTQWVLSGGGRWYILGRFDGHRFTPETARIPMGSGPDFYATQTWNNAPRHRRVAISWLFGWNYDSKPEHRAIRNAFPTAPWAGGCLTVPSELSLRTTAEGVRLVQCPVSELESLRAPLLALGDHALRPGAENPLAAIRGKALDVELEFDRCRSSVVTLLFPVGGQGQYAVGYNAVKGVLFIDRRSGGIPTPAAFSGLYEAPLPLRPDGSVSLRVLVDACSVEVFGNDGAAHLSAFVLPDPAADGVQLGVEGAECRVRRLNVYAMGAT